RRAPRARRPRAPRVQGPGKGPARGRAPQCGLRHPLPAAMSLLILGLVVFLGVHSTRIFAEGWRTQMRRKIGEGAWKGVVSVLSIVGFVLIVVGYGEARMQPTVLWPSPTWTKHLASLLTLPAFVLLVAAYVPGNGIKSRLHHPMV